MLKIFVAGAAGMMFAGCVGTDDLENSRFRSFVGLTMAEFSAQTTLTPSDMYDVTGGRMFVVATPTCRMLIMATLQTGAGSGAESWRVAQTTRSENGCALV